MIADRYEVDPSYFADKYGMPVGERINRMQPAQPDTDNQKEDDPGRMINANTLFSIRPL